MEREPAARWSSTELEPARALRKTPSVWYLTAFPARGQGHGQDCRRDNRERGGYDQRDLSRIDPRTRAEVRRHQVALVDAVIQ